MLFNKDLTEPDNIWRDWIAVACLWLLALGCLGGNALDFQRFKYLRWALSGMSAVSAGLGVAKVRQIDVRSPYYSQREVMRNDLFIETQAMQLPSFQQPGLQPAHQQAALMPADNGIRLSHFNVAEFLDEVTGAAILGNSGSGKTTLAQYIAGHLPPSQIIVFDADADKSDDFYPWGDLLVVNEYAQIIEQMEKLLALLEKRDKTPLVIICDEFPAIRAYAKQIGSDIPDRFILQYGSRGRKRNKFPIFISQSGNVKSLGLDGQGDFLENFALIRLQKIAHKYLKNHPDRDMYEASKLIAYPMLIGDDELVIHPTHGGYPEARKNLPPMNLNPLISLPITIPLIDELGCGDRQINLTKSEPHANHTPTPHHTGVEWLESLYKLETTRPHHTHTDGDICPHCGSHNTTPHGKTRAGTPRKRCDDCGKTFTNSL